MLTIKDLRVNYGGIEAVKGITLVPEGRRVFPDMTVIENIKIGAYLRTGSLEEDIKWV